MADTSFSQAMAAMRDALGLGASPEADQNADPWARFPDAPQPQPSDGGDLSGPSARRLPGERPIAPRGTTLQGPGEFEDPEAAAYARSDAPVPDAAYQKRLMDQINQGRWYNAEGAKGAGAVAAVPLKWAKDAYDAADQLMRRPYEPGTEDEQSVAAGATASSVAGFGARGISHAIGADTGSLGTFIGKVGARRLEQAGDRFPKKILDAARDLDAELKARGWDAQQREEQVRAYTNPIIEREAPELRGVSRGRDGEWRVELSDTGQNQALAIHIPTGQTVPLNKVIKHPQYFAAYPELNDWTFELRPGNYAPEDAGANPATKHIWVASSTPRDKLYQTILHEITHPGQRIEGHANGSSPERAAMAAEDGGPYYAPRVEEGLRAARSQAEVDDLLKREGYYRTAGESEARVVAERAGLTPAQGRFSPPRYTADVPYRKQTAYGPNSRGKPTEDRNIGRPPGDGGEPSSFEQAQENTWEDLARKGEGRLQPTFNDRGGRRTNAPLGQSGGGPGPASSSLWSREVNLGLAQMYKRGEQPADIAAKLGNRYTEDQVVSQLEALGLVGSNRKLPASAVGEWQPDAMAILQSDRVKGMPTAQIARLIEEETGQVTTKNAVIGKMNRLRQEKQRAELAEDLAKSGTKLRAAGVPVSNGDAEKRRRSWPILDRINFWGGY